MKSPPPISMGFNVTLPANADSCLVALNVRRVLAEHFPNARVLGVSNSSLMRELLVVKMYRDTDPPGIAYLRIGHESEVTVITKRMFYAYYESANSWRSIEGYECEAGIFYPVTALLHADIIILVMPDQAVKILVAKNNCGVNMPPLDTIPSFVDMPVPEYTFEVLDA